MKSVIITLLIFLGNVFQKEKPNYALANNSAWAGDNAVLYEQSSAFQVNSDEALDQLVPDTAVLNAESVAGIWQEDTMVSGRIFYNNGTEKVAQFLISNPLAGITDYASSITSSANGGFAVAWGGLTLSASTEVYVQRYDSDGNTVGSRIVVASYALNTDLVQTSIKAFDNGDLVLSWVTTGGSDTNGYGVYTATYDSSNTLVGSITQMNSYTNSAQQTPKVGIINSLNAYTVSWESENQDLAFGVYGTIRFFNQTVIAFEFPVATTTAGDQYTPASVTLSDGTLLYSWDHYNSTVGEYLFLGQFFYPNSTKKGSEFQLLGARGKTTHNTIQPTYLEDTPPSMCVFGDDYIFVVYHNSSSGDAAVYGQVFSSEGAPIGGSFLVDDQVGTDQVYPSVDCSDETIAILWVTPQDSDGEAIYGKIYGVGTATPTAVTSAPVLTPTGAPTLNTGTPSLTPTAVTSAPVLAPTGAPTLNTGIPSLTPTVNPTLSPSQTPSSHPSLLPTQNPSLTPTTIPSLYPTELPSKSPSLFPSQAPSESPSSNPSLQPSMSPSQSPSSWSPTLIPTQSPSSNPSLTPTQFPTMSPSTTPTQQPTMTPSIAPSQGPSINPTGNPSITPTQSPSSHPTYQPTVDPSKSPTVTPTWSPSASTVVPSVPPSQSPTFVSSHPTLGPTSGPTAPPTIALRPINNITMVKAGALVNGSYAIPIPLHLLFYSVDGNTTMKNMTFADGAPFPPSWILNLNTGTLYIPANMTMPMFNCTIFISNGRGDIISRAFALELPLSSGATTLTPEDEDGKWKLTPRRAGAIFGTLGAVVFLTGTGFAIQYYRRKKRNASYRTDVELA